MFDGGKIFCFAKLNNNK